MNDAPQVSLRVAFYIRVSTEEQADKYGPAAQEEALNSYLKSQGKLENGQYKLIHAKTYQDDISGTIGIDERPAFSRLKKDIIKSPKDQRPFDIVAVYKIDRFARKLKVLMDIIELFGDYDIKLISATESIDTTTPFGRAILGIVGVIAELEVENIRQRTSSGRLQAINTGIVFGTTPKYGYVKTEEKKPMVFEEEAKIVRDIFNLFVYQKLTVQMIATQLTNKQIPSPQISAIIHKKHTGNPRKKNPNNFWRANTVRDILYDSVYIGNYFFDRYKAGKLLPKSEWKLSPYRYPWIISKPVFEKAQKLLQQSLSRVEYKKKDQHWYLLTSLLKCDHCKDLKNNDMINWLGEPKKMAQDKIAYYYECGRKNTTKFAEGCNTVPLPADEIENYIVNFMKKLLDNPVSVYNYQLKLKSSQLELKYIEKEIKHYVGLNSGIPGQIERWDILYTTGGATKERRDKACKDLHEKSLNLDKRINELLQQRDSHILTQDYEQCLELFKEKYIKTLDDAYKNREEVYKLLHNIIEEIIVYSRPKTEKDKIAGRKKQSQFIPHRLHIKLRLPKDILQNMYSSSANLKEVAKLNSDFGVKNAKL